MKVLQKLVALYLAIRVPNAHQTGTLDTNGKIVW